MKIPTWLLYGISASICWGVYIVISKIATSRFGIGPKYVSLFMLVGIAIVFLLNAFFSGQFLLPQSKIGIGLAILAGVLWAIGMVVSLRAIGIGADVSKLAPIYNTNTLVAVLLGIILLHELPAAGQIVKVIIGAILIVVGAILVSF